eukprot:366522-Chlamydomonas_euryale.AAC.16
MSSYTATNLHMGNLVDETSHIQDVLDSAIDTEVDGCHRQGCCQDDQAEARPWPKRHPRPGLESRRGGHGESDRAHTSGSQKPIQTNECARPTFYTIIDSTLSTHRKYLKWQTELSKQAGDTRSRFNEVQGSSCTCSLARPVRPNERSV